MANTTTIRLSITKEMSEALRIAKKRYPTLSDPEILKLGLSRIVTDDNSPLTTERNRHEIRHGAAFAVGSDYLGDVEEDVYTPQAGTRVHFL